MSKTDPSQLIDRIWSRAYLDTKEKHVELLNAYADQRVNEYKEKLKVLVLDKRSEIKPIWHNQVIQDIATLIDKVSTT